MSPSSLVQSAASSLLQEMMSHRKAVLRQVAGTPSAAVLAAAASPSSSTEFEPNPKTASPTRPSPAALGWLERMKESALVSGIAGVWSRTFGEGRELMNRSLEALDWSPEDHEFFHGHDNKMVQALAQAGYLRLTPRVEVAPAHQSEVGPSARSGWDNDQWVVMPSDRIGDLHLIDHDDRAKGKKLARHMVSTLDSPEHTKAAYRRWHTLFHEAAHCDYQHSYSISPLRPSPGLLPQQAVEAMNHWACDRISASHRSGFLVLNENHSDVFATMMLLEASDHDPRAMEVIQEKMTRRMGISNLVNERFSYQAEKLPPSDMWIEHAAIPLAVKRALDNVEQWRGRPPEEIREHALRFASDGLLDYLHPSRPNPDPVSNGRMGRVMIDHFMPSQINAVRVKRFIAHELMNSATRGADHSQLGHVPESSPMRPLFDATWERLAPKVEAEVSRGAMQGETAEARRSRVLRDVYPKVLEMIEDPSLPINDKSHPLHQQAQARLSSDRALVGNALASMTHASPSWGSQARQARVQPEGAPGSVAIAPAPAVQEAGSLGAEPNVPIPSLSQWRGQRRPSTIPQALEVEANKPSPVKMAP